MTRIIIGKPRQCGMTRFAVHQHHKQMWESMFPNTPYPFEYGGVMTEDGLVTFGVYEKKRHLPVLASHYQKT
jgi:hypothetical protein